MIDIFMSAANLDSMRTTVRLDDGLLRETKALAARKGTTLTAVLEEALREWLARHRRQGRPEAVDLPVSDRMGGLRRGIDLDDSSDLLEKMEENAPS